MTKLLVFAAVSVRRTLNYTLKERFYWRSRRFGCELDDDEARGGSCGRVCWSQSFVRRATGEFCGTVEVEATQDDCRRRFSDSRSSETFQDTRQLRIDRRAADVWPFGWPTSAAFDPNGTNGNVSGQSFFIQLA